VTDVFELRLQGIVVRFQDDWQLVATAPHGAYLTHRSIGLSMHVRGWHRCGNAEWLRAELHAQNWKGPPFDIVERNLESRNLIGGTFRCPEPGQLVREWFISDGKHSANACLPFPDDTQPTSLAPYEQLLDSIAFD
jgi:hypothetical protein